MSTYLIVVLHQQELTTKVLHVNFIYPFVPQVIYSLWICTFAITKLINKILHNQIQYTGTYQHRQCLAE